MLQTLSIHFKTGSFQQFLGSNAAVAYPDFVRSKMAPKQSKLSDGASPKSNGEDKQVEEQATTPVEEQEQEQEQTTADPNHPCGSSEDPLVSQIASSMSGLSLAEMKKNLRAKEEEVEKLKKQMKVAQADIKDAKKKLSEIEKPFKEEEKKERNKERVRAKQSQDKMNREKLVTINFVLGTKNFSLTVPHNITTGKLRQRLVELLGGTMGIKTKTKFLMRYNGNDIYNINGGLGLKGLHTIPVPDGATIVLEVLDNQTTPAPSASDALAIPLSSKKPIADDDDNNEDDDDMETDEETDESEGEGEL